MITSFEKKKHLTKDYTYKSSMFYILATNDRKLKILQNTKLSTLYLGRSTGNPDYMLGIQSRQRRGFRLGHTQGVKVLTLVIASPAVDLTVLSQGQAVGGPCSHINHLLPWGERRMQI